MKWNIFIKQVHLYAGLQATVALILFAVAVIAVSLPESDSEPEVSYSRLEGKLDVEDLQLALAMHEQLGLRFEGVPEPWMLSSGNQGELVLTMKSPRAKRELSLDRDTGMITIASWPLSVSEFANHMHQEHFGRRRLSDGVWLWAWSLYIEVSIVTIFILPVTGVYLWMVGRKLNQKLAVASLFGSLFIMVMLWHGLR